MIFVRAVTDFYFFNIFSAGGVFKSISHLYLKNNLIYMYILTFLFFKYSSLSMNDLEISTQSEAEC